MGIKIIGASVRRTDNFAARDAAWNVIRQRQAPGGDPGCVRPGETVDAMKPVIERRVRDFAGRIGVAFVRGVAETVMTIGQAKALRMELDADGRRSEFDAIFCATRFPFEEVIASSYRAIDRKVSAAARDNCPLVMVSHDEAVKLAGLLDAALLTGEQWDRNIGWKNDDSSFTRTTYPVQRGDGTWKNGIVWEWTQDCFVRGGSRFYASTLFAFSFFRGSRLLPHEREPYIGVRFSRLT